MKCCDTSLTWNSSQRIELLFWKTDGQFQELYVPDISHQVYNYSLSLAYSIANSIPRQLEIVSNSSSTESLSGILYVTGNITNLGPGTTTHASVIVTFYDSKGYVVWVDEAYSEPHDIMPGGNASFTLSLPDTTLVPLVAGYGLTAESDQYAIIPEYRYLFILPLLIIATAALAMWHKKKTSRTFRKRSEPADLIFRRQPGSTIY